MAQRLAAHSLDDWPGGPGLYCPYCRQRSVPLPYFSRGLNLAKSAGLLLLSPLGPLVFFLLRRDRVLCSWCKHLLPDEVDVPLLDSFSSTPVGLAEAGLRSQDQAGALLHSGEGVQHEVALHERKNRRSRGNAITFGVVTTVLGAAGGTVAANAGPAKAIFLFSMSGLCGISALASTRRAKHHRLAAEIKRQRVLDVLNLAKSHAGKLTVTTVAAHLRLDLREAEGLLDGMVDGRRVDVEVEESGRMTYVFPEVAG